MRGFKRIGLVLCWLAVAALGFSLQSVGAQQGEGLQRVAGQPEAREFDLPGLEGNNYRLSDLRGKVVLVNFWATWCPPCREEMPSMQGLYEDLKNEPFEVLAVNVGEQEGDVFPFVHGELEAELTFPILLDPDAKVIDRYPVRGLPTSFLVDKQGRLAYKAVGGRDMEGEAFRKAVLKLLAR
ncbi:TlpA family protein disulfide reductase [Thiohalorhabdus sp.]|uniref:TlpA family protein disulfide reductase n=1 Tax=Thiohalorhabdus sp. TaxID=3094134 RepID=UPI002FC27B58